MATVGVDVEVTPIARFLDPISVSLTSLSFTFSLSCGDLPVFLSTGRFPTLFKLADLALAAGRAEISRCRSCSALFVVDFVVTAIVRTNASPLRAR